MGTNIEPETSGGISDTIAAVATANGRSALGVVRIAGPATLSILQRYCRTTKQISDFPRVALLAKIFLNNGELLDEVIVLYFPAPHSYTGDDLAEISFHGNPIILRRFILQICEEEGVRPAEPGEFTRRAFINGKMDLTEAESIERLVSARNEYELTAVRKVYSGELKRLILRFRSALVSLKAEIEAGIDFSTEDLTYESRDSLQNTTRKLIDEITAILRKNEASHKVSAGLRVAIAGRPNAGKSSLLNVLTGKERAIVTAIAGTTRDYIVEELNLDGVPVHFIDTAGLRETEDEIEKEGIRRSRNEIHLSDLVLHVLDASLPAEELQDIEQELSGIPEDTVVIRVWNKIDKSGVPSNFNQDTRSLSVSCKTGAGIDELLQFIRDYIFSDPVSHDPFLLEDRHQFHFRKIKVALEKLLELWRENTPEEICVLEIDTALEHIGRITGEITTEDILGRIFSTFCIGK